MLLAFLFISVACEYPGIPHPQAVQSQDPAAIDPAPTAPTPAGNPSPVQTAEPELLQNEVRIGLHDFRLEPGEVSVRAGTITFVLNNEGRYTHDFRVEGMGADEKAPKVGRGRNLEWRITLKPGTYNISCPISNHADRGMVGTLTVVQ